MVQVIVKHKGTEIHQMFFNSTPEAVKFTGELDESEGYEAFVYPHWEKEQKLREAVLRIIELNGLDNDEFVEFSRNVMGSDALTKEFKLLTGKVCGLFLIRRNHPFVQHTLANEWEKTKKEYKSFIKHNPLYNAHKCNGK